MQYREFGKLDWKGILRKLLPYVDLFLPSAEEGMFMLNKDRFLDIKKAAGVTEPLAHYAVEDFEWMGRQILEYGAKMVVVKSGHRGAYIKTSGKDVLKQIQAMNDEQIDGWADRELWGPSFQPPKFGSAAGSGDSFIAGFLAAFLKGCSIEDTITIANCVGCQNITEVDTLSGIGTWEKTLQLKDRLKPNDPNLNSDAWNRKDGTAVWERAS